jgi:EmrB/QacA subfamily drug resistance transporter
VLLGGILTEYAGWEWVLWVNVPIGVIAAILAPRLLVESRRESDLRHFDALGAISVTAGLSLLVFALVDTINAGWGSTQTLGLLALALVLLVTFVFIELRSRDPLMPFGIFRLRTLTGANLVGLLVGAALFAMFFFLSRYMQEVLGYSALKAGLSYLPLALAIIMSAGIASVLVTKLGFRPVLLAGLVFVTIGLLWFAQVPEDGVYLTNLLAPMVISAVGLGFAFVPVTIAAVSGVSKDESGLASGLINTSQQIGGALGLAVLGTIAASKTTDLLATAQGAKAAIPGALTEGFQLAFLTGAGFAILGIIATLVFVRAEDSQKIVGTNPADLPMA